MSEIDFQVSENLLQLWDYFLIGGWKSILKMGLFVLKDSNDKLLTVNFEEILNEITEKPKELLVYRPDQAERSQSDILYHRLRASFRIKPQNSEQDQVANIHKNQNPYAGCSLLSFHLHRLALEFEESHSAAKLQPKHNKPIHRSKTKQTK